MVHCSYPHRDLNKVSTASQWQQPAHLHLWVHVLHCCTPYKACCVCCLAALLQLMRKILCTRDHGYSVLSKVVREVRKGAPRVALDTGEEDLQLVIESQQQAAAGRSRLGQAGSAEFEVHMSQEGDVLDAAAAQPAAKKKKKGRPPAAAAAGTSGKNHKGGNKEKLPVEIVEALLEAYPEHIVRQHQQQQQAAGSSDVNQLLPKEEFIRQLVATCCEGECQEKVVIFSQVSQGSKGGPAQHMMHGKL